MTGLISSTGVPLIASSSATKSLVPSTRTMRHIVLPIRFVEFIQSKSIIRRWALQKVLDNKRDPNIIVHFLKDDVLRQTPIIAKTIQRLLPDCIGG